MLPASFAFIKKTDEKLLLKECRPVTVKLVLLT